MKKYISRLLILCSVGMLVIIWAGCEYDTPVQLYPKSGEADPVISQVVPDSAVGGLLELTIIGENFSPDISGNFVYFGTVSGKVVASSESEIKVIRPVDISGETFIHLTVAGAFQIEKHGPVFLEEGVLHINEFGRSNSMTVDGNDNLYVEVDEVIYKRTPAGVVTEFSQLDFKTSAMKIGPDGFLYLIKTENYNLRRISPDGGEYENVLRLKKKSSFFDFGEAGAVYSGSIDNGLIVSNMDGRPSIQADAYEEMPVKAVRVFEDYVYVAADTIVDREMVGKGIYRHQITSDGELGPRQLVFDFMSLGAYQGLELLDLTFSEDGIMYIGVDQANPIIVVDQTGGWQPLYGGLLTAPATQLVWGSDQYLYVHRRGKSDDDSGVMRLIMGKKGALYWGRN